MGRVHSMSSRSVTGNRAGIPPRALQNPPLQRTLLPVQTIERWMQGKVGGVCKAETLRPHSKNALHSLCGFDTWEAALFPSPSKSLNTGVFFSEQSLEIPWASRSSCQAHVWEGQAQNIVTSLCFHIDFSTLCFCGCHLVPFLLSHKCHHSSFYNAALFCVYQEFLHPIFIFWGNFQTREWQRTRQSSVSEWPSECQRWAK